MATGPSFEPAAPYDASTRSYGAGIDRTQSMMERASRLRQSDQMEQMRAVQLREQQAMEPLVMAKTQADIVTAKTAYDAALNTQTNRSSAMRLWGTAQDDFNFVNQITDDKIRAQASREWLSRYSQLANISEISGQVKQMRDLATDNISSSIKINLLGGAEARSFQALIAGMTPEEQEKAKKIKVGLDGRASGAAKKSETLTLPDGKKVEMVFDPKTGEYSIPQIAATPAATAGAQPRPAPTDANPFVGQSTYDEANTKAAGTKEAEYQAKLKVDKPKREFALKKAEVSTQRLSDDLDKVIEQATAASTGLGGVILSKFPGSAADNLRKNIESVKSGILLEALGDLKAASPTGASGFGSLTEAEGDRLAAQFGSLEPNQSPEQFIANAKKVKQRIASNLTLQKSAFESEYENDKETPATSNSPGSNLSEMSDMDLEARLRKLQGK